MTAHCALCDQSISLNPIIEGDRGFCCLGCHAVFNILFSQKQLDNFQNHPVFQQALRTGLISNPNLLFEIKKNQLKVEENELEKLHLEIDELWCPSCAEIIKLILLQKRGVKNCVVDYSTDLASIEFSPRYISKEEILSEIKSLGYQPHFLEEASRNAVSFQLYLRFIVAVFCSLNVMMFAYPLYASYFDYDPQKYGYLFAWLSFAISLPVLFYSGWPILKRFWSGLRIGFYGMEALVVMGVSAAFGLSTYELLIGSSRVYFDSMTVIIVFVLFGKIIEARAKFSAKDSLFRLTKSLPRRGRKKKSDGSEVFVSVKDIQVNDELVIFSGEKIILDGVVERGDGLCDESLMTGESIPSVKKKGSQVLSGTVLLQGHLTIRVTSTSEQSTLKKIIEMVELDLSHKSIYIRSIDSIVRWFAPVVIIVALFTGFFAYLLGVKDAEKTVIETAILRSVAILLISCPCAIGIAAPLAESHLLNALAALGAIVRNRGCLPYLGKETVFVFDKTGTITEGCFKILEGLESLDEEKKRILKGLTSQSIHPISRAISQSIDALPKKMNKIEELIGKGIKGDNYLLGSAQLMKEHGVDIPFMETRSTLLYFAKDTQLMTTLVLGDVIREEAKELSSSLKPSKTILLSGDSTSAVKEVAKICHFDSYLGECSPLQKRDFLEKLRAQGEVVCMLGDGINDAPALAGAQIGISVVSATDLSIQVSDILLTVDRLSVMPKIRLLAQQGQRILKQNLFWAFFYNVIGIGLAIFGLLSPIFAAFAMVASSLMVLFNAQRIRAS